MSTHSTTVVLALLSLAIGAGVAEGQTIEKISRVQVWEPGPEGNQVPLWPASVALLKPEGDRPEEPATDRDWWRDVPGIGRRMCRGRP